MFPLHFEASLPRLASPCVLVSLKNFKCASSNSIWPSKTTRATSRGSQSTPRRHHTNTSSSAPRKLNRIQKLNATPSDPPPPILNTNTTTPSNKTNNDSNDEEEDENDSNRTTTNSVDEPELALILIACGIGISTGASVVVFNDAIHFIRDSIWHGETLLTGRELLKQFSEFELWPRVVMPPILGGLFVGIFGASIGGYTSPDPSSSSTAPNRMSSGSVNGNADSATTDRASKFDAAKRPIARAIAAAVTLGTGASLGPEGPSVDIGRSCATGFASTLRSRQRHLTSLLAAGSGAGVAAGFNAPIAGVFFAVETVLQKQVLRPNIEKKGKKKKKKATEAGLKNSADDVDSDNEEDDEDSLDSSGLTIAMILLASVLAAVVSQAGLGSSPAFRVPEYRLQSLYELPLYLVFGALCGVVSASFSYSTRVAADAFEELRSNPASGILGKMLLPSIGGLTTGVLALGYPEILYQGFDNVNSVLSSSGEYAPSLLIQIVVVKIIATAISRGSGLQGGLYAPSIFVGAALGSAFGLAVHALGDPSGLLLSAPQAYALVGVGAMLASNCGVPLTAVLLLFELTRDYLIIVPTLAAVGISFWISSLAAPSVRSAAARRRAAAFAAATAVSSKEDTALLENLKQRLRAGALLQDNALSMTVSPSNSNASEDDAAAANNNYNNSALATSENRTSNETSIDLINSGSMPGSSSSSTDDALTLACAIDRGCLLVQDDMSLAAALALMEAEQQTVAVVIGGENSGRGIVGMISRDIASAERLVSESESESEN